MVGLSQTVHREGIMERRTEQSIMFLQNSLRSILRTAHCRSTHHYFALDALPLVQTASGKRLAEVLLRFHERYLIGATDPDTRFRDFQNHVIHVKDGYWGGAPRMAHKWYDRMQRYLRTDRFSDAAHAAGVLSHYFTDPFQPLHTQQSEREKVLHRPIEWSIHQSYNEIFNCWRDSDMEIVFQLSDQIGWLGESMLHASEFANRKCTELLDEYDLLRAVDNPKAGLNTAVRGSLAELFGLAITGWARVLERAAAEAEATRESLIPSQPGTLALALATVRSPLKWWQRQTEGREEQQQIALMLAEYASSGDLNRYIPAEVDIVHKVVDIYRAEKLWQERRFDAGTKVSVQTTALSGMTASDGSEDPDARDMLPSPTIRFSNRDDLLASAIQPDSVVSLSAADSLSQSPFINTKVSGRLAAVGVHTVGDFLQCSADELSAQLSVARIAPEIISEWQMQVSLMMQMSGIGTRPVQLLVAAGYMTVTAISQTPPKLLYQKIHEVASSSSGRRFIQGASCPRPSEVSSWIAIASAHADLDFRQSA